MLRLNVFGVPISFYISRGRKYTKKRAFKPVFSSNISFYLFVLAVLILLAYLNSMISGMNSLYFDQYKSEEMNNDMETPELSKLDMVDYKFMPILTMNFLEGGEEKFDLADSKHPRSAQKIKKYIGVYLVVDTYHEETTKDTRFFVPFVNCEPEHFMGIKNSEELDVSIR